MLQTTWSFKLFDTILVFSVSLSGWTIIFLGGAIVVESSFIYEGITDVRFVLVPSSISGKIAWNLLLKRGLIYKSQV